MAAAFPVEEYVSGGGARVFRLPLEVFPRYRAYAHLVACEGRLTLVDVGSSFDRSFEDLVAGLKAVETEYGLRASLDHLDQIIITHGHIDHFTGLARVRQHAAQARIGAHELTGPVLTNYEERVLVTRTAMADFLRWAGVPDERQKLLLEMYMFGKRDYRPVPVDFTVRDGDVVDGVMQVIHVPGHSPGLIMLQLEDVLLTADHVLPETSVALAPEGIMPYNGVGHYLESLDRAYQCRGVRVALGGHERAMPDYYAVVQRTRDEAVAKLERVLEHCDQPRTIYEIASLIYGALDGYSELLKIEQTGARIEYLNQRGRVKIDNLHVLEEGRSQPLRYVRVA
jgi:glyoxylase-like metal-dependent hydrolase (beta-lactamase superfamily II)